MSDKFSIQLPAGLTVIANVRNLDNQVWDGEAFVDYADEDAADYEISMADTGGGVYSGTFPSDIPDGNYSVFVYSDGDGMGGGAVLWVDGEIVPGVDLSTIEAQIAALSAKITTQTIIVVNPARVGKILDIVIGDDYKASRGRALTWITPTSAVWPDLTGATVTLTLQRIAADTEGEGDESAEVEGAVITATGENKEVSFDVEADEFASLLALISSYKYRVWATWDGGDVVTLAIGTVNTTRPAMAEE